MKTVPLPLAEPQAKAVRAAAKRTGLSQADVMRQSIIIGLPVFLQRLCPESDYLHPPPLSDEVLEKSYVEQSAADRHRERKLTRASLKPARR